MLPTFPIEVDQEKKSLVLFTLVKTGQKGAQNHSSLSVRPNRFFGPHWDSLEVIGKSLEVIGTHWKSLESHWDLLELIGSHWDSLGLIGTRWKLMGFTGNQCK